LSFAAGLDWDAFVATADDAELAAALQVGPWGCGKGVWGFGGRGSRQSRGLGSWGSGAGVGKGPFWDVCHGTMSLEWGPAVCCSGA
jgi:hypothetical protein